LATGDGSGAAATFLGAAFFFGACFSCAAARRTITARKKAKKSGRGMDAVFMRMVLSQFES
jgi:hypothetical protein